MAKSICERIRNVKSSLENAEQSFRENNGMRGELDLMLAGSRNQAFTGKKWLAFHLEPAVFSSFGSRGHVFGRVWRLVICGDG